MTPERLGRLRARMVDEHLDALIVSDAHNVRWLSGFSGSNGTLVVTPLDVHLFTDSRYTLQAADDAPETAIHISSEPVLTCAAAFLADRKDDGIGFESDVVTYDGYRELSTALDGRRIAGYKGLVSALRMVKDAQEVREITRAAEITDAALGQLLPCLKTGISERDAARELAYILAEQGAERESFAAIVAAGERSALPHARPSDRELRAGDIVLLDFGAQHNGYAADITRTYALGRADGKLRAIYALVLKAQIAAIEAIRPGIPGKDVDAVARAIIIEGGYGECFGHGLGHMLGLDVHDGPGLSPRSTVILEEGNVVTVEPGIYVEGWGGVRIEDDVVVTADGCRVLTHSPKHLTELPA